MLIILLAFLTTTTNFPLASSAHNFESCQPCWIASAHSRSTKLQMLVGNHCQRTNVLFRVGLHFSMDNNSDISLGKSQHTVKNQPIQSFVPNRCTSPSVVDVRDSYQGLDKCKPFPWLLNAESIDRTIDNCMQHLIVHFYPFSFRVLRRAILTGIWEMLPCHTNY